MYIFDFRGFTKDNFEDYKKEASQKQLIADDYIGNIRVGKLCFDLVTRCHDTDQIILTFDLYVGGVDTGYGYSDRYEKQYPYDYADGGNFINIESMNYLDFQKYAEDVLTKYINESEYTLANLPEKASEELVLW